MIKFFTVIFLLIAVSILAKNPVGRQLKKITTPNIGKSQILQLKTARSALRCQIQIFLTSQAAY
jgi:hypothetical protein